MSQVFNQVEMTAIRTLLNRIKDEFQVKKMILFGSKAKGEAEKYSDIDLLILTAKPKLQEDRWKLSDIAADVNIDYGVALSCLYFNEQEWDLGTDINPLLKANVEKEGIVIDLQGQSE